MILVVVLLVRIMDCKTKLFPTAVLPIGQNTIQLVLVHKFFQVEILGNLQIRIFLLRLKDGFDFRRELVLSIPHERFRWLFIYFHPVFLSNSLLRHHIWELRSWSYEIARKLRDLRVP